MLIFSDDSYRVLSMIPPPPGMKAVFDVEGHKTTFTVVCLALFDIAPGNGRPGERYRDIRPLVYIHGISEGLSLPEESGDFVGYVFL